MASKKRILSEASDIIRILLDANDETKIEYLATVANMSDRILKVVKASNSRIHDESLRVKYTQDI